MQYRPSLPGLLIGQPCTHTGLDAFDVERTDHGIAGMETAADFDVIPVRATDVDRALDHFAIGQHIDEALLVLGHHGLRRYQQLVLLRVDDDLGIGRLAGPQKRRRRGEPQLDGDVAALELFHRHRRRNLEQFGAVFGYGFGIELNVGALPDAQLAQIHFVDLHLDVQRVEAGDARRHAAGLQLFAEFDRQFNYRTGQRCTNDAVIEGDF